MGKKYLLTFSLAAISCMATKSIRSVMETNEVESNIEVVNNEELEMPRQAALVVNCERLYY